jgi:two-component system, sporulation sensor kinase A
VSTHSDSHDGEQPGRRGWVLVVEDDDLVARALSLSLRREGYDVLTSSNIDEALPTFDANTIDVVVTDLLMPGGTGIDLLRLLEQKDPSVPVIIVTADGSVDSAAAAVRERAFDYLTKPISRDHLTATVARAIELRRSTQLKAREEHLLKQEHRQLAIRHQRTAMLLSVLYNRAVEGILVLDGRGRVVDASDSFVGMVGMPLYQLLDTDIGTLIEPHPTEGDMRARVLDLVQGPVHLGNWRGDVTVRAARGRRLPAKISLSVCETPPVEDDGGQECYVIALVYHDTAYQELSQHLQQADRLATIGLLAGSAAHEIKNELGPLLGYLTMIEQSDKGPVESGMIRIMRESVRRVQEHVEQILEPLRPRVRTRGPVLPQESIEGILVLLRRAGKLRRMTVELDAKEDVVVHADKNEVHQIALNLITNAIDALGDGGGGDRGSIWIRLRSQDTYGVLRVEDSGSGLAPELRARVFEPFFTTKGSGGTGLGLPVVHDIVRSLRGSVTMEDRPEGGTVVTVKIPLYRAMNVSS